MPRGVRVQRTDDERLQIINQDIAEMTNRRNTIQAKIDKLNAQKKEILVSIEQKKLAELADVLAKTGKTPDDILNMLKAK